MLSAAKAFYHMLTSLHVMKSSVEALLAFGTHTSAHIHQHRCFVVE